jgi:hypothetical protein
MAADVLADILFCRESPLPSTIRVLRSGTRNDFSSAVTAAAAPSAEVEAPRAEATWRIRFSAIELSEDGIMALTASATV